MKKLLFALSLLATFVYANESKLEMPQAREASVPVKSINLSWIVVDDLKQAVQFYTEVVGLKLEEMNEQYGWAELGGHEGGARLGIAKKNPQDNIKPGQNAVVTLTVADIEKAKASLLQKGVKMVGDIMDICGMVKLQMAVDQDNNHFQLVEIYTQTR